MATSIPTPTKFSKPFAVDGDRDTIPVSGSNVVNQGEGFPAVYSKGIEDGGKFVPRTGINGIFYALSSAISNMQQGGVQRFDQAFASAIGGYAAKAILWHTVNATSNKESIIVSLINNNTFNPETNPNFIDNLTDNNGNIVTPGTLGASVKWKTLISPDCLPLAGGTMKGTILSDVDDIIIRSSNNGVLRLLGSADGEGAAIVLNGSGSANAKAFSLLAGVKALSGLPNGALSWDGKNIVRSVNGVLADASGNVAESRVVLYSTTSSSQVDTVNLTESWRGFRYLIVTGSTGFSSQSSSNSVSTTIVDVDSLKFAFDTLGRTYDLVIAAQESTYPHTWCAKPPSFSGGSTDTAFTRASVSNAARLFRIVGVK